jgi:adenosylcobinamide kinase/adenosylcobinamide-phosphate guanylyltransferase
VGAGIVPEHALARRFRDLAGVANQRLAAVSDEVVLVACGLPVLLKSS